MKIRSLRLTLIIILGLALSVTYTVYLFINTRSHEQLPTYGQVHNFQLFDEQGKEFNLAQLAGDIWIANFFFTTCGDICPIMTKNLAALHRSFDLVDDVKQISITVNPEFDSPNVLKNYAEKFNANTGKWHFLTGTRAQITRLAVDDFKLGDITEPVFHSAKFALVDRHGMIRGYYDGVQAGEVSQLFSDVAQLMKEE